MPAAGLPAAGLLLECRDVVRRYGGVVAVAGVTFEVREGEILGVIGPNGSGKSTLLDMISGVTPLSEGRIALSGHDITHAPSWKVARLGLARTFQMLRLFPQLTVRANLVLAESWRMRSGYVGAALGTELARGEERELDARAERLLAEFDLGAYADHYPSELSMGQQRLVEIARCLMTSPQILLLDEPAAGLSPPNVDRLVEHIEQIRAERGATIVLVEHVMRVVMSACDRVVVLDQGRLIADDAPAAVAANPAVVAAYLGLEAERAGA